MPKLREKPQQEESFEKLFGELQTTIDKLETGDLALDESLALFQRGMELAKKCGEMLDQAELRIKALVTKAGQIQVEEIKEED